MEKWLVLKYVWIASVAEWSKAMVLSTIERNCSRGFEPRRTQHTFFFGSFLLSSKDFLQRAKVLAASSVVKPPLYSSNLSTVNALYLLRGPESRQPLVHSHQSIGLRLAELERCFPLPTMPPTKVPLLSINRTWSCFKRHDKLPWKMPFLWWLNMSRL